MNKYPTTMNITNSISTTTLFPSSNHMTTTFHIQLRMPTTFIGISFTNSNSHTICTTSETRWATNRYTTMMTMSRTTTNCNTTIFINNQCFLVVLTYHYTFTRTIPSNTDSMTSINVAIRCAIKFY